MNNLNGYIAIVALVTVCIDLAYVFFSDAYRPRHQMQATGLCALLSLVAYALRVYAPTSVFILRFESTFFGIAVGLLLGTAASFFLPTKSLQQ